ncbi:MAG: ribbon-helix-helix protein, CopG family [Candidatus Latescibacteria bacterium]|nr:ribbon-helix-helix protein, CopG family [Candidatus Latescibacterota bacterium]
MTSKTLKAELEAMRLPELRAKFAGVTGEETKAPNKKFLIRKIIEAMKGSESPEEPADTEPKRAKPRKKTETPSDDGEPKLSKLDVPALQKKYEEVIGRTTRSESRSYLFWKIRQAHKGKVPIGPLNRGEGIEHKVLPVRVPAVAVADLDECWKRLGMKSRTEFFRRAVHAYLEVAGETDTAALFA